MFNKKTAVALAVSLAMLVSPMAAFADFTDIGEAAWAESYIEKMADESIVTGYEDGTFRPNDNISKYASILMIYRTLKAADLVPASEQTANINKHMSTIVANGVPDWPDMYGAVAYCLENDIIAAADLNNFHIGDIYTNSRRFEVAVFLGKTMNIYLEENLNVLYTLDFKDASSIVSAARPYVYLLGKYDVVGGDTLGYFNPSDPITRAAMAKMLSVSLDLLREEEPPVEDAEGVTGIITNIIGDTNRVVVQNNDDEEDIAIYNLADVEIIIDGREESIDDLDIDMTIRLNFDGEALSRLTVVDGNMAGSDFDEYDATFYTYISIEDYFLVTLKGLDGDKFTYATTPTAPILKEGKPVALSELERGDFVNYTLVGDEFTKLEGFGKSREYEGIFQEYSEGEDESAIVIKGVDGKTIELVLDDDYDVEKNGSDRTITNLYNGDFVVVTTDYEKVVLIVASSTETEESGIVRSILIAAQPQITIMTDDNEEKTFDVDSDADIEIAGSDKSLYDLRLNYSVDLILEGGMVTEIQSDSTEELENIDGTVYNIYASSEKLKIKYIENGSAEYIYVYVDADDTAIFSSSGRSMDFEDIDDGDKVFIYGNYDGDNYVADKIFVLE
ncbi:MAG: S-layer homology domain-containing protein [Peptostreptococcaceae bacterium]|nr:S-layer homology domain-containing protein [Peptostreptococcaceae bacterium]